MKNEYLIIALLYIALAFSNTKTSIAQLTAYQADTMMPRGINIGNSLDAIPTETSWGNPLIQEYYFDTYKNAGFNCVRIPITWDAHVGTTSPFTIDPIWLNRVEQIVDWGLSRGLFIIINAHHESWLKNNPSAANIARFDSIWTQIASHFSSKSDHLFFEILNEPNPMSQTIINNINVQILSIIRSTNPTRIVIYSGNNYSNSPELMNAAIPDANDPYLMGYYHSYDPWSFAGQAIGTWGTAGDRDYIKSKFDQVKNWSDNHHIPVILSEFGAQKNCEYNSRQAYYTYVVQQALSHNIPFQAWDDNGDFQIYQRYSNSWNWIKDILINTQATDTTFTSVTQIDQTVHTETTLFPNPAKYLLNVYGLSNGVNQLEILDMTGRIQLSKRFNSVYSTEIDISVLPKGLYILNVITPDNSFKSLQFVKE